jgi:DNA-binding NarL/FixJ family response regulator
MSPAIIAAAGFCGLLLAGTAAGMLALFRVRALMESAERRALQAQREQEVGVVELHRRLEALAAAVEEMRALSHFSTAPPAARPGMNLNRRSQALRLYRRGEPAARIAQELGLPVQEVELLIKVHEIVLSTV